VSEGRIGCLILEGDLQIAGERQQATRYFFLSAGQPQEARTEKGCLVVALALGG
jgi:hypothetical protein